ncbi:MAG: hypothetical protein U0325_29195 [Polyangiales bacterium]
MDPADPVPLDASRERVLAALLYFAARFVPVPLLDDVARAQVATWVVVRAAAKRGVPIARAQLAPLGEDSRGLLRGCLGALVRLALAVVLFPVRKVAALVFGVRNLVRDVLEVVLLARAVDRALDAGLLRSDAPEAEQRAAALRVRGAFDRAFEGTDLTLLQRALLAAKVPLGAVIPAALRRLRALRGQGEATTANALPAGGDDTLERESDRVGDALSSPAVRETLRAFDARMDQELRAGLPPG